MSSVWGKNIHISIFGESHGTAIGVVVDGLPAGIALDEEEIGREMARRVPRKAVFSTARRESDHVEILSGFFNGKTTGSPLAALIRNQDAKSRDYENLMRLPRPGHADYVAAIKYKGFADMRGGGHFSGRITAPLVFAGAVAKKYLGQSGIRIGAHIAQIGKVTDNRFGIQIESEQLDELYQSDFPLLNKEKREPIEEEIRAAAAEKDSIGGMVECAAIGIPVGLGEPMMDTVESKIASILFAVPAIKGVEFGSGFTMGSMRGSEANDAITGDGEAIRCKTNHNGGITGGITNGMPIIVRAVVKPTPSIARPQETIDLVSGGDAILEIKGRHDSCIVPRALSVIEAAMAIALMDLKMEEGIR